jgi:cell division FtsZ-interacting protein ZapD
MALDDQIEAYREARQRRVLAEEDVHTAIAELTAAEAELDAAHRYEQLVKNGILSSEFERVMAALDD